MSEINARLSLFPQTAEVNNEGRLTIGGCDAVDLAAEFGTPLYIFDEATLRRKCAEFKEEFGRRYPNTVVLYASKAFINRPLVALFKGEGLGLDVVSAGELGIARAAGFPMDRVYFHGNNKSAEELKLALEYGVGRNVVDNFTELEMLGKLAHELGRTVDILLRLTPGIDPHTHKFITTGIIDSKFGFPLAGIEEAVLQAQSTPQLNLMGLHFHIGSLIFEVEPYRQSIEVALKLTQQLKRKYGFELKELDVGGGFAIRYTVDSPCTPVSAYAEAICTQLTTGCHDLGIPLPRLVIEPGRAVVGQAGVALYTIGVSKKIVGVRQYVSVDGGMGDNIRPALYEARYEALVANKVRAQGIEKVTIAGRFCESGDILIKDIELPPVAAGDLIAIPDCGAYCIPMSSNYNASFKPAIVMVVNGKAQLIRRRETLADLLRCDA